MFFILAALAFAFASCSNSAGGGSPSGVPIVYTDTGVTNSGNDINPLLLSQEERLQTEHVKIEKLQNGLKFTITRPSDDCYDSSKLLKEIKKTDANGNPIFSYDYVGYGKGSYERYLDDVGQGNGDYKIEDYQIKYVGAGNGNMKYVYTYKGPGNGSYEYTDTQKVYGGWGWVAIYRVEIIDGKEIQTTCAAVSTATDKLECFYPLCDAGERYVFKLQIEPSDIDNNRKFQKNEYLAVTALGGIGDIDYSNTLSGRTINLSYDGEKPIVTVSGYTPPQNARNARTYVDYFCTNQNALLPDGSLDWNTNNATKWFANYESKNGIEYIVEKDFFSEKSFNSKFDENNKDSLYTEYSFAFDVPESSGMSAWRTVTLCSKILKIR